MHHATTTIILFVACWIAYVNSLRGDFIFDDHFAVTQNRDVLLHKVGRLEFLRNDFWGQPLTSTSSHKSYRPLTVFLFRCLGTIGRRSLPGRSTSDVAPEKTDGSSLNSWPFHFANIMLHATATILVYWLTLIVARARERMASDIMAREPQGCTIKQDTLTSSSAQSEAKGTVLVASTLRSRAASRRLKQPAHSDPSSHTHSGRPNDSPAVGSIKGGSTLLPDTVSEACIAAALFAWHPIHTEAVAGIVGLAEVLCAVLFLSALLLYVLAIENMHAASERARLSGLKLAACAAAIFVLSCSATFAKELGVTVVVPMIMYDLLLAPHYRSTQRRFAGLALRGSLLASCVLMYVSLRHALMGGQQLVTIFRRVENPIAYEEDRMTRMLSMGHLHASYAWLLVAPWRLSADYSHACIPLLHSLYDPRNAFTAALYGLLAHQMLRGLKPVSRVIAASLGPPSPPLLSQKIIANQNHGRDTQQDCGSNHSMPISASEAAPATASAVTTAATVKAANFARREAVAVWRVFMIVALVIAPFVPSSNVLFYVGTFIGERLLYLPSIGYCMLVGQAVVSFAGDASLAGRHRSTRRPLMAVFLVFLLGGFLTRTVTRNRDWASEEALFTSAARVCPNSAKVQLNSAILMRRQSRWESALQMLDKAQSIEPTYCEADFWRGLTMLNANKNSRNSLAMLERGVKCRHTEQKALLALNQAFLMYQGTPAGRDPAFMSNWGRILASANRTSEACASFEQLADALVTVPDKGGAAERAESAMKLADMCHAATLLPGAIVQPTVGSAQQQAEALRRLAECAKLRGLARRQLLLHGTAAAQALRGAHSYLEAAAGRCSSTAPGAGLGAPPHPHTVLIHTVQLRHSSDPVLQEEWGAILAAEGRHADAITHFKVAALLFSGNFLPEKNSSSTLALSIETGQPTLEQRLAAVLRCFASAEKEAALQRASNASQACDLKRALCDTLDAMRRAATEPSDSLQSLLVARDRCSRSAAKICRSTS